MHSLPRRVILAVIVAGLSLSAANADIIPVSRFSEYRFVSPGQPPVVHATTAFGFFSVGTAHTSDTFSTGASLISRLLGTGGGNVANSTFRFTFSILEAHQYSFSGAVGGVPGLGSGSAGLSGPGVSHMFSAPGPNTFSVTGFMQPGTYTVVGLSSAGGVGIGGSEFILAVQIPAPATALVAPMLCVTGRRRRRRAH